MKTILAFCTLCLLAAGCNDSGSVPPLSGSDYLPLEIGNYWKVDDDNYVEVTGTEQLNGQTFFVLRSRNGSAADPGFREYDLYFRVDEQANLIQGFKNSTYSKVVANFNLEKGQKADDMENPTVTVKTADLITFRYDCMVCSAYPSYYYATFLKGRGFAERNFMLARNFGLVQKFTEIKIGGNVYKL